MIFHPPSLSHFEVECTQPNKSPEPTAVADLNLFEKTRAIAIAGQSQYGFDSAEQNQWCDNNRDKAKNPFATRSRRTDDLRLTFGFWVVVSISFQLKNVKIFTLAPEAGILTFNDKSHWLEAVIILNGKQSIGECPAAR
jgi:hypothetical protein